MEIVNQTPISIPEMKDRIAELKKRDKELNFRGKKVEEYVNQIAKIKDYKTFKKDLEDLNLARLKEKHITLIINIGPADEDSLKTILSSENLTLKQEDINKIIEIVKKHV